MQINCPNCNKKFEINDDLIPSSGRLLQCGSCSNKWFYKRIDNNEYNEQILPEAQENDLDISIPIKKRIKIKTEDKKITTEENVKKKGLKLINFFKLFLVLIITFISLIILIDTFKTQIFKTFPSINFVLENLYETLKDINLFFKDLIK